MDHEHPEHHRTRTRPRSSRVVRALASLPEPTRVHDDLYVPGTEDGRIDHLVIGPTGVWSVSTKAWEATLTEEAGMLWRGRYPIQLELAAAATQADRAAARLGRPVRPVLCFDGTELPRPAQEIAGVQVVAVDALAALIADAPAALDADQQADAHRWAATLADRSDVGPDRRPASAVPAVDVADLLSGPPADQRHPTGRLRRRLAKTTAVVLAALAFMYVFPRLVDAVEDQPDTTSTVVESTPS